MSMVNNHSSLYRNHFVEQNKMTGMAHVLSVKSAACVGLRSNKVMSSVMNDVLMKVSSPRDMN